MGGRIWVESEPHRGSAFHFVVTLPISAQVIAPRFLPRPDELVNLPALVVDDNATNRRILVELLSAGGCRRSRSATQRRRHALFNPRRAPFPWRSST
jgi:hypothetical protein